MIETTQENSIKILIISDSHGHDDLMKAVIEKEKPFDVFFHLGDSLETKRQLEQMAGTPVYAVAGNCDFLSPLPLSETALLGGHKIRLVHGHQSFVNAGPEYLIRQARRDGCDIVIYGHTHVPLLDETHRGVIVINPGSITYPRQNGRTPTYAVLELAPDGKAHARIHTLAD